MPDNLYRCAAVFTSKNIMVYQDGKYQRATVSNKINGQVLVGDYLLCEVIYGEIYANEIVARTNVIRRLLAGKIQSLVSNVDIIFIVTSANQDFNIARLERYYIIAKESGAKICFVLSKIDLEKDYEVLANLINKRFPQSAVEKTSIYQANGVASLWNHWNESETAVFLGSSGVGKSSLINLMLEDEQIETQTIRESDGHGRHTTTARHLYQLSNHRTVIDTPGLRSVGISANSDTIDELFPEVKELETKCHYKNCSHTSEPGCAIREAIESGELDYNSYLRYLKLAGHEKTRQIFLHGKRYQKEEIIKKLKKSNKE